MHANIKSCRLQRSHLPSPSSSLSVSLLVSPPESRRCSFAFPCSLGPYLSPSFYISRFPLSLIRVCRGPLTSALQRHVDEAKTPPRVRIIVCVRGRLALWRARCAESESELETIEKKGMRAGPLPAAPPPGVAAVPLYRWLLGAAAFSSPPRRRGSPARRCSRPLLSFAASTLHC